VVALAEQHDEPTDVPVTPALLRRVLVVLADGRLVPCRLLGPVGCRDGTPLVFEEMPRTNRPGE
jgi:hypothetical protein